MAYRRHIAVTLTNVGTLFPLFGDMMSLTKIWEVRVSNTTSNSVMLHECEKKMILWLIHDSDMAIKYQHSVIKTFHK